jgi:anti-sigma regulatory factor (Ser/Thr protein kinase)
MNIFELTFQIKPFAPQMLSWVFRKLDVMRVYHKKGLQILSSHDDQIRLAIRSQIELIDEVVTYLQNRVDQFCRAHQLRPVNLSLYAREALANAIIHGNLEVPATLKEESWEQFEVLVREREALPKFADRQVQIRCRLTPEQIILEVEDQGPGFDPRNSRDFELISESSGKGPETHLLLSQSGMGLVFIQAFTDQVFWNHSGNCITMIKHFSSG